MQDRAGRRMAPPGPAGRVDMMGDFTGVLERLDRLEAENRALRRELTELRCQLAGEVRTRRIVVETAEGFERIVGEAEGPDAGLTVHAPPRCGRSGESYVRLHADCSVAGEAAERAGIDLSAGGYGIASLSFSDFEGDGVYNASLWLNRPGRRPVEAAVELSSAGLHSTDSTEMATLAG
ncbi:MAG TPA: hypothetical protein VFO65_04895 [Acidimicrobiales bacterium]|nr:hypothetical protein [Acidimicrobiales bacterium]